MNLQLHFFGDPLLLKRCAPVEKVTPEIRELAEEMIQTMDDWRGIGLAASQVGILLQIFVVRKQTVMPDGSMGLGEAHVYINPKLTNPSKKSDVLQEGCLSLPGFTVAVERPLAIDIEYLNLDGVVCKERVSGFDARVLFHENDHLHGRLSIHRTSEKEKNRVSAHLKALKKKYQARQKEIA
ncbi:MAG: peptide deformylase [Chlamydiota bacterium]